MKIKSSIVVATAAGAAFAPNAEAADMAVKAPRLAAASVWNWTGLYAGAHLGVAWQDADTAGTYVEGATSYPFTNSTGHTGFIGGGQIGYNWQSGTFVYGLEADLSGLSGSGTASQNVGPPGFPNDQATVTSRNRINWLSTVRGRLGATFGGNTLLYATGGFAFGHVKNDHTETNQALDLATWTDHSTRGGYAIGGGIEHMFRPDMTVRLEALHVDLGSRTVANFSGVCDTACQPVTFSNSATFVRAGVNVRF